MKEEIRYAIWKAHNKRCAYTGHLIENFSDLEIDHIIPESICSDELPDFGLPIDYDLNSIENLLPTIRRVNNKKGNLLFKRNSDLRYYRLIAHNAIEKVDSEIISYRKKLSNFLSDSQQNFINKNEPTAPIVDKRKFEIKEEFTNGDAVYSHNYLWVSEDFVGISAYLPSKFEEYGSCNITIIGIDTMITLRHHEILEIIEQTENIKLYDILFSGDSYNGTKSFMRLGSNSVHLEKLVFESLVRVFQKMLNHYKENYEKFICYIGAKGLNKNGNYESFKLMTISRDAWRKLIDYSCSYDIDRGKTKEYCFNANGNYLLALDDTRSHIKFSVTPQHSENCSYASFKYPDDEVTLIWNTPSKQNLLKIEKGTVWTADMVKVWINETMDNIYNSSKNQNTNKKWSLNKLFRN